MPHIPSYEELVNALLRVQRALADDRDGGTVTHPDGLCLEEVKYMHVDPVLDALDVGCALSDEENVMRLQKSIGS